MSDIVNALPQGTILRGTKNTYQIQRALGQGTFGITYLATMETQVRGQMGPFLATEQVSVKEFFMRGFNGRCGSEVTGSSPGGYFVDYKRKFLREAVNLTKLQHPHIVKVLEPFEANGTAYYVMEYLDGGSLDDYIQRKGALKEDEALSFIRQVGSALEEMHAHRMLHLDLKPGNIMLRKTGEAVLIDFGLSKQFDKNGEPESTSLIGGFTPGYAPLEQVLYQRGEGLHVTMDVYALGATLYKMLTGECPPEASEVLNDGLPINILKGKGVSVQSMTVIEKAMAPMRKHRLQNVRAFMVSLAVGSAPQFEKPPVIVENTFNNKKRHLFVTFVLWGIQIASIVGLVVWLDTLKALEINGVTDFVEIIKDGHLQFGIGCLCISIFNGMVLSGRKNGFYYLAISSLLLSYTLVLNGLELFLSMSCSTFLVMLLYWRLLKICYKGNSAWSLMKSSKSVWAEISLIVTILLFSVILFISLFVNSDLTIIIMVSIPLALLVGTHIYLGRKQQKGLNKQS